MTSPERLFAEIRADFAETAAWTGRAKPSAAVIEAMARVPRAAFVPPSEEPYAYDNTALPIGCRQTISQPFIVALMTELLDLAPGARVLEIGTGSGYQAAVLAAMGAAVFSIETVPELAARARETLRELGFGSVHLRTGDGNLGWPEQAPFDAIIVTAAPAVVPPVLLDQLKPGGRMVVPVGPSGGDQVLQVIEKSAAGTVKTHDVLPVAFVPLVKH